MNARLRRQFRRFEWQSRGRDAYLNSPSLLTSPHLTLQLKPQSQTFIPGSIAHFHSTYPFQNSFPMSCPTLATFKIPEIPNEPNVNYFKVLNSSVMFLITLRWSLFVHTYQLLCNSNTMNPEVHLVRLSTLPFERCVLVCPTAWDRSSMESRYRLLPMIHVRIKSRVFHPSDSSS